MSLANGHGVRVRTVCRLKAELRTTAAVRRIRAPQRRSLGPTYPVGGGGTLAASDAVPMGARDWGSGVVGKGMEAKEWGRGDFLPSFLCLHSFAKSVAVIGVQIQMGQAAMDGPRQPPPAVWSSAFRRQTVRTRTP